MSKSVGQASYELLQKPPERINVIDMQREMQKTVQRMLDDIISKHKDYENNPEYWALRHEEYKQKATYYKKETAKYATGETPSRSTPYHHYQNKANSQDN